MKGGIFVAELQLDIRNNRRFLSLRNEPTRWMISSPWWPLLMEGKRRKKKWEQQVRGWLDKASWSLWSCLYLFGRRRRLNRSIRRRTPSTRPQPVLSITRKEVYIHPLVSLSLSRCSPASPVAPFRHLRDVVPELLTSTIFTKIERRHAMSPAAPPLLPPSLPLMLSYKADDACLIYPRITAVSNAFTSQASRKWILSDFYSRIRGDIRELHHTNDRHLA